ncbi:BTAD domain-containing putative transcriptional regulator [Streptomyces sp. WMMC500]|uniref:AfsR/SARP family transcriptional regulator n=1 Tax=Streptomyces sp. WMMC500 TaxID=3015154 RepID=UPI00248D2334|nr:BTAD domain-containing putative transcriptional regulator [Streptomyces sp. WMMC500]WBB61758.1 BTAD domain-containing putative transcriptional regulator [Streptomyces sp. WMMC500]
MTELRLLGPVELRGADGRQYALGPPQQRCVLAVLAMSPGRPVMVEMLIRHAWRDESADAARDVLYTYVSRLRRLLRQASGDGPEAPVLRRGDGGYVLDIAPGSVDLLRARALAGEGRTRRADDPERALRLIGEATALWRGTPLAGLRGQWAEQVRTALERERVTLLTERYDIELELGRHAESVAGLSAEVVEHPLVEPLAGQLMLALYRSGRQADALQVYARTRRSLVEEIGEEPGPELRRLHERILRRSPGLDLSPDPQDPPAGEHASGIPSTAAAESPAPPLAALPAIRPAQLPPDVAGFTGRETYLRRLERLLPGAGEEPSGTAICAVVGTAGVGKTTLALHWGHRVADRFPDGQLYVNLRGFAAADSPTEPAEALRGFLQALRIPDSQIPEGTDARTGLFRSLLTGRRMLVVLDNARDADQVLPLLPGAPGCATLITSRRQLPDLVAATGADQIVLEPFSTEEAQQLLVRRLADEQLEGRQGAVADVVNGCVRLPLALALAAAHLAARPGSTLAELADGTPDSGGDELIADVRTVFSWSYRVLSPPAARLFRLLGLHPGPELSTGAAAALAGTGLPQTRALLRELTQASVLDERAPGRFALHDLLRDYAAELAGEEEEEEQRRAAVRRTLDYYLHSAHLACRTLWAHRDRLPDLDPPPPDVTPEALVETAPAIAWFAAERRTLTEAVRLAAGTGLDHHVVRLGRRLGNYLDRDGRWIELSRLQETVLAAARRTAGDPVGDAELAAALCDEARSAFRLGSMEQAREHLSHAYELFCANGDLSGQAQVHHYLANLHETRGDLGPGLRHARKSLALYCAAGDRRGQGRELNVIGWIYGLLGKPELSLARTRQALAVQESVGDLYFMGITWDTLGRAHHRLGDPHEAIACFRRALELLESPDAADPLNAAKAHTALGDAQATIGDTAAARESWARALRIFEDLRHPAATDPRSRLQTA